MTSPSVALSQSAFRLADQSVLAVEVREAAQRHEELAVSGVAARQVHPHGELLERLRRGLAQRSGGRGAAP